MAEWLKAHAWKACIQQCIGGSNPFFSAIKNLNLLLVNLLGFFNSLFSPYLDQNIELMIENYLSLLLDALVAYRTNYLVSTKFILIEIITIFIST